MPIESGVERAIRELLTQAGVLFAIEVPSDKGSQLYKVRLTQSREMLLFEYFPALAPQQVKAIVLHHKHRKREAGRPGIIVRRLSAALMEACKNEKLAVLDLEGNAWVQVQGLYVERFRPTSSPGQERSSGTIFSAKASRVARALLSSYPKDWTQAQLRGAIELNRGYVSVLWSRLQKQGYASLRGEALHLDEPDRLLDDWRAHYRFDRHRRYQYALSMNTYEDGLHRVSTQLRKSGVRFAWTGWSGAHLRAPFAIPSAITAYVDAVSGPIPNLFPVDRQGNVILIVPQEQGVFQFTRESNYGDIVSDPQLYVDLCRMPGRAQEQADALRHQHLQFAEDNP